MRIVAFTVWLLVALYSAWVYNARRSCAVQRVAALERLEDRATNAYTAYTACAWDIPAEECARAGAIGAPVRRFTDVHAVGGSVWCAAVDALPSPLSSLFASAATVDLVVSRTRLSEYDATLGAFAHQCACGWPWWRTRAIFDHKVTYEFMRSGLLAGVLVHELREAASFYARFSNAVTSWVESVHRVNGTDEVMSDHGMLIREEARYASVIVRYILVAYRAGAPAANGVDTETPPPARASFLEWLSGDSPGSTAPTTAVLHRGPVHGTFTLCMSEVQISTAPAGDCDCVHDHALHQRLRETVDSRLKKHFADAAPHVIRAVPDSFADAPSQRLLTDAAL